MAITSRLLGISEEICAIDIEQAFKNWHYNDKFYHKAMIRRFAQFGLHYCIIL